MTMNQTRHTKAAGFTLIEVIVAIGIFTLIIMGVTELVSGILVKSNQQGNLLVTNNSARQLIFVFSKELRNVTTAVTGAYALADVSNQQLIFFTDTGTSINRVRYYIQNGALYKGLTKPSGNPPIYNLGSEANTLVQKDVANGASPLFYYYDGNYNGTPGSFLAQPVNPTTVKFIRMNLIIYKKLNAKATGTYTVTASGTIRNLKTNLGN
jgi:prepilin-type N-terminal cleavage/methylation domain-containing protein